MCCDVMQSFVPLFDSFESMYNRNFFRRVRDCWNRPVRGVPGAEIDVLERTTPDYGWSFALTGESKHAINMGSYNYLGFSANDGPCADAVERVIKHSGLGVCGTRAELAQSKLQRELEATVARFVGSEDAIVFRVAFATYSLNIPSLVNKVTTYYMYLCPRESNLENTLRNDVTFM